MKRILALIVLFATVAHAQYSIKGTMTPPDKGDWVILYKIEGAKQKFISNSTIKTETLNIGGQQQQIGRFELTLPADAQVGAYRATYRDKGAGFVDFLFNKENIEFVFNPEFPDQSIVFTKSIENKVYREYLEALSLSQSKVDSIQMVYISSKDKKLKKVYSKAVDGAEEVQEIYEGKSKGMFAHDFIKSSKNSHADIPFDNAQGYLDFLVNGYLNNVDFSNANLYNSSFLIDKITDYIFLLNSADSQTLQQKIYKESIAKVMGRIDGNGKLEKEVNEFLIEKFTGARNSEIVDWLFTRFYDKLPSKLIDQKFKKESLDLLTATVGRTAPDFSWKESGKSYSLSGLNDGDDYLLVFWSTQCSHCVEEIPELHEYMKNRKTTSVIAFAVEQNDLDFNSWAINKLGGWHNVMGTHPTFKWDNETVQKYQLTGTPTYFVLDKNKKIIAMPNSLKDIEAYYAEN